MKITLASVTARSSASQRDIVSSLAALTTLYIDRTTPYAPTQAATFLTERALLDHLDKQKSRTPPLLIALDSRGKLFTSEALATWIGNHRDQGQQSLLFAIGPPDGWSEAARTRAALLLAFGRMTLPHELMRVVLAEQIYRAFTILAGHPYHSGHAG